jgi:hypothetical protein
MNTTVSISKQISDVYDFKKYISIQYPELININYNKSTTIVKMFFSVKVDVKAVVAYSKLYVDAPPEEVPNVTTVSVGKTTTSSPEFYEIVATTTYNGSRYTVFIDHFLISSKSDYENSTYFIKIIDTTNNTVLAEQTYTNSVFEDNVIPIDSSKLSELFCNLEIQVKGDAVSVQQICIAYQR